MQQTEKKPGRTEIRNKAKGVLASISFFRPNSMETARNYDFVIEDAPPGAVQKRRQANV